MIYILPYSADKKYFQIQFGPVDYCLNWEVSYCSYMKTKSLRACIAFTQGSNNILSISSLTKVLLNVEIGVSLNTPMINVVIKFL